MYESKNSDTSFNRETLVTYGDDHILKDGVIPPAIQQLSVAKMQVNLSKWR